MFREILNATLFLVLTIITLIFILLTFPFCPSGKLVFFFGRLWAKSVLYCWGVTREVRLAEAVPTDKPLIIMSNHVSHADSMVLAASLKNDLRFITKQSLKYIPLFGWALMIGRFVFINRSNREEAFKSIELAAKRISKGQTILVFPEGTRSADGQLGPFKKGGFILAIKSGAPIIPVHIKGTFAILKKKSLRPRGGHVVLRVGRPIDVREYTLEDRNALIARVRNEIIALSQDPT
jgi:1-acyl-sn-glycerol-3-phosphate acyltransferase